MVEFTSSIGWIRVNSTNRIFVTKNCNKIKYKVLWGGRRGQTLILRLRSRGGVSKWASAPSGGSANSSQPPTSNSKLSEGECVWRGGEGSPLPCRRAVKCQERLRGRCTTIFLDSSRLCQPCPSVWQVPYQTAWALPSHLVSWARPSVAYWWGQGHSPPLAACSTTYLWLVDQN